MSISRQVPKYSEFDVVWEDIRDLLTIPTMSWMRLPAARRRPGAYAHITSIPLDLAAAGFTVTLKQSNRGWSLELECSICKGARLRLHGEARSLVSCLFQIADQAGTALDDLERNARRANESEVVA